jgi:hypothetical protein
MDGEVRVRKVQSGGRRRLPIHIDVIGCVQRRQDAGDCNDGLVVNASCQGKIANQGEERKEGRPDAQSAHSMPLMN